MSIAGVILAAGSSRRLGRPKQTVLLKGEMLVQRALRTAQEAGLSPVFMVVHPQASFADMVRNEGCEVLINQNATEGMAASIRVGVAAAQDANVSGMVLMACDQVGVQPELLRLLTREPEVIMGSAYSGKIGVPAYFPASAFAELALLQGDVGARQMLRSARAVPWQDLDLDVDTEVDLARARALFEHDNAKIAVRESVEN